MTTDIPDAAIEAAAKAYVAREYHDDWDRLSGGRQGAVKRIVRPLVEAAAPHIAAAAVRKFGEQMLDDQSNVYVFDQANALADEIEAGLPASRVDIDNIAGDDGGHTTKGTTP